jgi:excisionase family DNA binding protein
MDTMELVSVPEAARLLPVSQSMIYQMARDQIIPAIKIGSRVFVKKEIIDRVLREGTGCFGPLKQTPVLQQKEAQ